MRPYLSLFSLLSIHEGRGFFFNQCEKPVKHSTTLIRCVCVILSSVDNIFFVLSISLWEGSKCNLCRFQMGKCAILGDQAHAHVHTLFRSLHCLLPRVSTPRTLSLTFLTSVGSFSETQSTWVSSNRAWALQALIYLFISVQIGLYSPHSPLSETRKLRPKTSAEMRSS